MSGFDNLKLDEGFFSTGKCEECEQEFFPAGHVKSNFLCNIGYGDPAKLMSRGRRLDFNEGCTLLIALLVAPIAAPVRRCGIAIKDHGSKYPSTSSARRI